MDQSLFKAYDIRGRVPEELNEEIVHAIALAYASLYKPNTVVIGRDTRLESPALAEALAHGLTRSGVHVIDLGLCGTEEVYFHTFSRAAESVDGGIMVTASHNPKGYNGLKLVRREAQALGIESGLADVRDLTVKHLSEGLPRASNSRGHITRYTSKDRFADSLVEKLSLSDLPSLTSIADCGNGAAGPTVRALAERLPFKVLARRERPDGNFPHGVPNPLLPEMRSLTTADVCAGKAHLGAAWDGDFDRCFFFDEQGDFIESYYIVGLLARTLLSQTPGATIIHDPRLIWDTEDSVTAAGGRALVSRVGHAFMKDVMRQENAIYGGEMSAHHYFRDFGFCDSGMLTWLYIMQLLARQDAPFSSLVAERQARFPCSGELNFTVSDAQERLKAIDQLLSSQALAISRLDGLSLNFSDWRFNIRPSNTEPLLRLNVETRGSRDRLAEKVALLSDLITQG